MKRRVQTKRRCPVEARPSAIRTAPIAHQASPDHARPSGPCTSSACAPTIPLSCTRSSSDATVPDYSCERMAPKVRQTRHVAPAATVLTSRPPLMRAGMARPAKRSSCCPTALCSAFVRRRRDRPVLTLAELEAFDPRATARGNERRFCCPLPACTDKRVDPAHRSLTVNLETGVALLALPGRGQAAGALGATATTREAEFAQPRPAGSSG